MCDRTCATTAAPASRSSSAPLSLLTAPPVLYGQNNTSPVTAALQQPSYADRIKSLDARRQRQLTLGLEDEAARTAQELEALRREQQQICPSVWSFFEFAQARPRCPGSGRRSDPTGQGNAGNMPSVAGCGERPGAGSDSDDLDDKVAVQAMVRSQFENPDLAGRGTLFVEPVLSTATDADVPNPVMSVFSEFAGSATSRPTNPLDTPMMALSIELGRAGRDFDRMKALLEAALARTEPSPSTRGYVLEMLRAIDQQRGDIQGALAYSQSQFDLFQRTYGADSPRLCFPLWRSIPLLLDSQQGDRALAAAQRCLTLASPKGARSLTHASALNNLALVYQRTGSLALAVSTYEKAWATSNRSRSRQR